MAKTKVDMYEEILPDGRCKYRMPYVDMISRKQKTVSIIMDKQSIANRKIAKRTLEEKIETIMSEDPKAEVTLRMLADAYLADRERYVKPQTLIRNTSVINSTIKELGEGILITDLTLPYIKSRFLKAYPKAVTYNENVKRFKTMMHWAYMNDYLPNNSISDKLQFLPDNKKERIEDKYLEKDELKKLLDEMANERWNLVTKFLALSGLRIGELVALKDSDISQEYILVNKTYQMQTGTVSDTPKTDASNREVYLRPELAKVVKEIRSEERKARFRNGIKSDLFICWDDGDYFHYDAYRKYLGETSEKIIGRRITPHALRHTTASLLIADGIPLETVSRMLGHEGSKITKKIYVHITKTLQERDNSILKNANVL